VLPGVRPPGVVDWEGAGGRVKVLVVARNLNVTFLWARMIVEVQVCVIMCMYACLLSVVGNNCVGGVFVRC
jgi:hypothetical protein